MSAVRIVTSPTGIAGGGRLSSVKNALLRVPYSFSTFAIFGKFAKFKLFKPFKLFELFSARLP
jgi:hypothetical protein